MSAINQPVQTPAHPSRSKPFCIDCKHLVVNRFCNHPSAPVDLVTGFPNLMVEEMRSGNRKTATHLAELLNRPSCGPDASLFAHKCQSEQSGGAHA